MALERNKFNPGDPLPADDVNAMVGSILNNEHNIFELFLENFFAGKATPFNGLFFDGFSDTTKADTSSTVLITNANSGQADLEITLGDDTKFSTDRPNITIFDGTNAEEKIIQSITAGFAEELNQSQGVSLTDGEPATGADDDDRFAQTFKTDKTGRVTKVVMKINFDPDSAGLPSQTMRCQIEATTAGQPNGTVISDVATTTVPSGTGLKTLTFNFSTPAPVTAGTQFAIVMFMTGTPMVVVDFYKVKGDTTNSFADGKAQHSLNNGSTWADDTIVADYFFELSIDQVSKLTLTTNLTNSFLVGDDIKRSTVNFDTGNKKIDFTGIDVGDDKKVVYFSKLQGFQTAMANTRLWVVRNFTAQFTLDAGISAGATTLTIAGDQTGKFANGNTIDISNSDNTTRERKTLTATPTFSGGVTTLTFSATINAFTTFPDFVERVDVIPQISVVDKDAAESFNAMTFIRSIVDFANNEVEDEYSFDPSTANEDVVVKLDLTREDVSLVPFAKRLGVTLNE